VFELRISVKLEKFSSLVGPSWLTAVLTMQDIIAISLVLC
jgi:hypothetical protein